MKNPSELSLSKRSLIIIAATFLFLNGALASKPSKLEVRKTLSFALSKERVWLALTDEKELGLWWNKGVRLEAKVGGEFYEPWGDGQLATGQVLAVQPREFIEFSWREKTWKSHEKTICRFSLELVDAKTIFTMKHTGWEVFPTEDRMKMVKGFDGGWDFFLSKLKRHLSKQEKAKK